MKKTALIFAALAAVMSCNKYDYSADFSAPTELSSPESISLDPTSSENVVLSWTGGGAKDGGIVLYNVIFDEADGDFSEPLTTVKSDNGGLTTLTMTQAALNNIARSAGIKPLASGSIKWTVTASRGGVVKQSEASATISLSRPEGIDNFPERLYIEGSAAADDGQDREFRQASEGVFDMFIILEEGEISFNGTTADGTSFDFYVNSEGKLTEGEGTTAVTATDLNEEKNYIAERLTVDFNTLSMKREKISDLHIIWAPSYGEVGPQVSDGTDPQCRFTYDGNGVFSRTIDIVTVPFGHSAWFASTPSTDTRYYFNLKIDDADVRWRNAVATPTGDAPAVNTPLSEYSIAELPLSSAGQWDNAFKMNTALNNTSVTVKIYGNKDGYFCHQFE